MSSWAAQLLALSDRRARCLDLLGTTVYTAPRKREMRVTVAGASQGCVCALRSEAIVAYGGI